MSLGTRLTLKTAVLVLAVVVVAGAALWGLGGLNRDLDRALGEYDRLRKAYMLINNVERARDAASSTVPTPERISQPIQRAVLMLEEEAGVFDDKTTDELKADLMTALQSLDAAEPGSAISYDTTGPLYTVINRLAIEITDTAGRIASIEVSASRQRTKVLAIIATTAGLTALIAIIVGIWQYRAVMQPLRRLQRGVERLASGDFADQLESAGDREFVQLANDFNRMADDLATLYEELEEKVRLRSAQLAQSERLASVGFLAAGVAHEINNPLAIIAGEAELALGALPRGANDDLRQALTTARDEAFRCKGITQKLVSLARPGSSKPQPVALNRLAEEVVEMVRTLPQREGRGLQFIDGDKSVKALTEAAQVKQVLLNLVINALEAIEPGKGEVRVGLRPDAGNPRIFVQDNGRGMDELTLERVFQPFYTSKKSPSRPGLGLGLSISHAIIEDLGGTLTATSPGPGQGSTFTIELPATRNGTT
ncbi:MAG: HAMP domain-containing sensor histidine kinase [Planctomycetota bacterium]